jgi:hypothetical protein
MFSTSVGLLLKGHHFLVENNETTEIREEVEQDDEKVVDKNKENFKTRIRPRGKLIDSLKSAITDIFDDESSNM